MRVLIENNGTGGVRLTYQIEDSMQAPEGAIVMSHDEAVQLAAKTPVDLWEIVDGKIISRTPKLIVPQRIYMWQFEAVLRKLGLHESVDNEVRSSSDIVARTAWEKAPYVSRQSALLAFFAEKLGVPQHEIDSIFIEAAKIKG